MEKIGIIVEARMGSSRFPGKVMKKINNKPLLYFLIKRLKKVKNIHEIIVAVPSSKQNNVLVNFLKDNQVKYFKGSENNVLLRVLRAAEKFNIKKIISITGDCPCMCPTIIERLIEKFNRNKVDYMSSKGFLGGMDCQIYSIKALKKSYSLDQSNLNKEHVTLFIRKSKIFKKKFLYPKKNEKVELKADIVVDEKKDFLLVNYIFNHFKKNIFFQYSELLNFLNKNKKILKINKDVKRKGDN